MIRSNWKIFGAKFSDDPQGYFQWLSYILFCKEYDKKFGIAGYFNQRYLETNPITKGNEVIGWQAKYYDTPLTAHKTEILKLIKGSKKDYPKITKIIFYSNQNWGQGKKQNDPQGKIEIDNIASKSKIEIDWKHTGNFFDSLFTTIDNEQIAKHFFSLDKSIFDLIKIQNEHSKNILAEIKTSIRYNSQNIEIDRSLVINKLRGDTNNVTILNGSGGVGKTAIIKKYYEQLEGVVPFYIFKATEFEISNINSLFPGFNFQDFIIAHKEEREKIVVIDSAERLLDLKNRDPLKEFLSALVKGNWKIILTTRDNYLDDLNYQFLEIYNIPLSTIKVQDLELSELKELSSRYSFFYPKDHKLLTLLQSTFYLNEYLKFCGNDEKMDYLSFKEKLWDKEIKKSKPAREQCFLKVALTRANSGQFFVTPDCESQILDGELRKDGILGYETPGYFITHDIYEEWALEKSIENEFRKKTDNKTFFQNIGSSLPVRRSVRSWVSQKLLLGDQEIKIFIEEVIGNEEIESFWKDELLVSVLLSNHSDYFFGVFKDQLLANDQELLKKLTFLLRIACKEIDGDFFKQLGIEDMSIFSFKYVLTKPKGLGWEAVVKFVYDNIDKIGIEKLYFVLPIIHDWNSKYKSGKTTRLSSLIAIRYYQWIIEEKVYFSGDDTKDKLIQTILYGSSEIRNELSKIIAQIVANKWKKHSDPYYELSNSILTKLEGINTSKTLPVSVLQLADLFWTYTPRVDDYYPHQSFGRESLYGLEETHLEYFPSSSYQTPIYWLLQSSPKETVDFILSFTNKSVDFFIKSKEGGSEEVEVVLGSKTIKQVVNTGLWCAYRGTQSLPGVIESMHMALEKFFLENGKEMDQKTLESWLTYLIVNSKSASISSVVTSVTLAYPDKTFNVAKILFKTKQFFLYDTTRLVLDEGQKSSLLMLKSFGSNTKNEYHQEERIKACDAKHRLWTLENLFLNYQIIRSQEVSEEESKQRQIALWEILDEYYKKLPAVSQETDSDKTWRLYLARMDRRKMKPETEKKDGNIIIKFNPEIDPNLKKFSEAPIKKNALTTNFIPLDLWAKYKIKNNEEYKKYVEYEGHPENALKDIKKVLSIIKKTKDSDVLLLDYSIPAYVCSVLIRDYYEEMPKKGRKLCVETILDYSRQFLKPNYKYQVIDGTEPVFCVIPKILKNIPEYKEIIKTTLLLGMFNDYPVNMAGSSFSAFSISAVHKMWGENFEDAQSMLFGYLILKPKYESLRETIRREEYKKRTFQSDESILINRFLEINDIEVQKIVNNQFSEDQIKDIENLDLDILRTAFLLIPLKTKNKVHKKIVKKIIATLFEKLLSDDREDKVDYDVQHNFFEKLSYFVLSCRKEEIQEYLKPVLDSFCSSKAIADMLEEFVYTEDYLGAYENFWTVWELFYKKIIEISKKGDRYWYTDEIIKSYLFSKATWKETATSWHTLKDNNANFFQRIIKDINDSPSVLYSISKLLNDIGSSYLEKGIDWISFILNKNNDLKLDRLETNTIYYIENLLKKYIYANREKIRKTRELTNKVLIILDFLVKKGSVVGYMLRENIL